MTVNRTYTDPSEAGTMDLDTGGILTETIFDAILSNLKNLGSTDSGKARVTTQFDKTNTTLANVTGLTLDVEAAGVYEFRVVLFTTCAAAGGAKVALAGTCTATAFVADAVTCINASGLDNGNGRQTALGSSIVAETRATTLIIIEGLITVNTAGTLTVQFAQNATSGTSSVLVGSHFRVKVLA